MDPISTAIVGTTLKGLFSLASNAQKKSDAEALSEQEFQQALELERTAIREQLDANLKLADYQTERNLEFWNMQNEYNSPVQQMARFKKAGLNPALIYSQGSPGNASEMVKYQAPTASKANYRTKGEFIRANLKAYQDLRVSEAQVQQMELQNKMIEANIAKTNAETEIIPTKGNLWATQGILNDIRSRKTDSDMIREQQLHGFKLQQADLTNQLLEKDLPLKDIIYRLNEAQARFVNQQIEESKSKVTLNSHLGDYFDSSKDLNRSKISKLAVDQDISEFTYHQLLPQVLAHKKAEIKKLVADGKISAAEAQVRSQKLELELKNLKKDIKLKNTQIGSGWIDVGRKALGIDLLPETLKGIGSIIPL